MAALLLEPPPPFLNPFLPPPSNPTRPFPHALKFKRFNLSNNPTLLLSLHSQPTTYCAATPQPESDPTSEPTRIRRRAVRLAWEKLVRWFRSLRSRNKTDVLERTNKVVVLGGGSFATAIDAVLLTKRRSQLQ